MKVNKRHTSLEVQAGGESPPLLDPSKEYRASVVDVGEPFYYMGGKKICISFEFLDFPTEERPILYRAYNWYTPLPPGCDLFKDCERILGKRIKVKTPIKIEKIFKDKVFVVKVRTVTKNAKRHNLSEVQQYSVVDEIVRVEMADEGVAEKEITELKNTQNGIMEVNDDDVPF